MLLYSCLPCLDMRWGPRAGPPGVEVPLWNWRREPLGSCTLPGDIFNVPVRRDILQRVVRWQLAKRQQVRICRPPLQHCSQHKRSLGWVFHHRHQTLAGASRTLERPLLSVGRSVLLTVLPQPSRSRFIPSIFLLYADVQSCAA